MKRILSMMLALVLMAGLIPAAARAEEMPAATTALEDFVPETYSNEIESKMPTAYGERRTSFLGELADGGYQMVVYRSGVLYVAYFDSGWNCVGTKTVELELPLWGGVYLGEAYNYVVCGQRYDSSLTDGGEVYRVIKYDKDFQRLDSISFTSSETYTATPFYFGNVSMDESEDTLTVYTSRLRKDGHQSNIALRIYTEDMTVRNSYGMASIPDIHASHSFRQIVKYDGDTAVYVDLADGYPIRSVYIQYGSVGMPLMELPGTVGDNITDAEVTGLEISDTHYFAVGTYLNFEEQNVYLSCVDKETKEVTTQWLTSSTAFEPKTLYAPRIVKTAEDRFVVMWNNAGSNCVQYLILDAAGSVVSGLKSVYGTQLTDCEPVFSNGGITWLSIRGGTVQRETITDLAEEGTYEWEYPLVEAVDPWDGTSDTSWYHEGESVFSISTAQQLAGLSELAADGNTFSGITVNLENDIFMNDLSYTHDWPSILTWEGTFNGNGHTIYNIYQADESGGLFQTVGASGIVKAVDLAQGLFYTGGSVADLNQGIIAFCTSHSLVYEDEDSRRLGAGAICDENQNLVYGCRNYGKIIGSSVAGIVGLNSETISVVSQCSHWGTAAGIHSASGVVAYDYGWVYNNYARGLLSSTIPGNPNEANYLAGIVRYRGNYDAGDIESCYSICSISCGMYDLNAMYAIAPDGIVNGYSQLSGTDDQEQITVLSAEQMRSAEFVDLLNRQTNTVLPAWVMDTEQINDGYPITVADYNYQQGIYKIQPELWLDLRKVVSMKPGQTVSASCESYYNETAPVVTVEDSSIVTASLSGGTLTLTALQNGQTYVNIHFDETENVIATDYRIKIFVDAYSGYCGDTVTWSFDETTGVLDIGGTGPMYDYASYSSKRPPWFEYRAEIRSVRFDGSITSIGDYAFSQCTLLSDVTLPDGVVSIGDHAFSTCTGLTDVALPESLCTIGDAAFKGCSGLTQVTIPQNVGTIGEDAFHDCKSLTAIHVHGENDNFSSDEYGVLFDRDGMTLMRLPCAFAGDYVIADGVTAIDAEACYGCEKLTGVTIPDSVTDIGQYAFYGCSALDEVSLGRGITSLSNYAFAYCRSLTGITIPDSVTRIGNDTFYYCTGLTTVTIPDSVTSLGSEAFCRCTALTSVTIPDSVVSLGSDVFSYCTGLTSMTLPDSVTSLGGDAFYNCSRLNSITLSSGLTSINSYTFYGCGSLKEIVIPRSETSIGRNAFSGCSALSSVAFRGNAPSIGDYAFSGVTANMYYPNNDDTWTADVMLDYGGTLTWIPAAPVHEWGEWTTVTEAGCTENGVRTRECQVCGEVETEEIPAAGHSYTADVTAASCTEDGLTVYTCTVCGDSYGETLPAPGHDYADGICTVCGHVQPKEVASGWSGYTTWVLTSDGKLTFSGEGAMKNYTTKDGMPWYDYRDQITSVVIEDGVTSIGSYAFYGMGIESIDIPGTVTTIGEYAFKGAEKLDGVVLPAGLTKLGESAFYGCTALTSIEIPASLWTVQPYTFKNCTSLSEVTFHEGNLQKISDGAFYGTALKEVTFPDCLDILDVYSFKNCAALETITLGSGLTEIREAVFYGTAIPTIVIPEGITKIGPYAFKNCVNLETIDLPSTLLSVGEASFYACTALESLDLPDAVTTIGNYAFRKCAAIEILTFGSGLVTIGECSFYGCTGLTEIVIPDKVTTIKPYAFKICTGLTSVTLGSSVETIGEGAFNTCTGLKTLVFPASLTAIGDYCFSGSWNLWKLTFQGDAPTIGTGAFKGMAATAYYPGDNATWTSDVMQNYGGTITWMAN